MSTSEKLKVLFEEIGEAEDIGVPVPQIVAVVEAAESGRDRSVLIEEHVSTIEKVAWRVEDAQALQSALRALDEALS